MWILKLFIKDIKSLIKFLRRYILNITVEAVDSIGEEVFHVDVPFVKNKFYAVYLYTVFGRIVLFYIT